MIRNGKSAKTMQASPPNVSSAMESRLTQIEQLETEVVKWVKSNPLLGIGIALAIGVGVGLVLKRRG